MSLLKILRAAWPGRDGPHRSLPMRAGGYAWRRSVESWHFVRSHLIVRRYARHYRRAQRVYRLSSPQETAPVIDLSKIGVHAIHAGTGDPLIRLPPDHDARVTRVARAVDRAFASAANCLFFPAVPSTAAAGSTREMAPVVNGEVIQIKLRDPFSIDGLYELCDPLMHEIERIVYGSYVLVDKVYVYRNPVSRQTPRASWRWHFDNHPVEMMKVMVYLTEVTGTTGPFEYLRESSTGRPLPGGPITPLFTDSRVPPERIARLEADGWERERVTGPRGTVLVFDHNVVHRATLAQSAHRDVVVFQIRPATFQALPRIDPRWTGTFGHFPMSANPYVLRQRLER